jgi:hypothetical protein
MASFPERVVICEVGLRDGLPRTFHAREAAAHAA